MGYHDHDAIAMRWVDRAFNGQQFAPARKGANLHDEGDSIFSYGRHFEVARILRDHKRRPVGWLLNGNTFSVTTSKHQGAVRNAIARNSHGLPTVTIPHAALEAAGIEFESVQIIDVQDDWWTERIERKDRWPGRFYETETEVGGWQNSLTGEYVSRVAYWGPTAVHQPGVDCDHHLPEPVGPWKLGYNWYRDAVAGEARDQHIRLHHGVWEEVPSITRRTGRVRARSSTNVEWDIVDEPGSPLGYVFERTIRRHWLGASLIRAAVIHHVNRKHDTCGGTGIGEERWHYDGIGGEGPLTRDQHEAWVKHQERIMERNSGLRQPETPRQVETYRRYTDCRGCSGTGKVRTPRRRWAYYLSGFDTNESRPSYFFCELPPKATPATVEEAYVALKPDSVKLAELMGREVKRQGDIFAIPMPNADTRLLKRDGQYSRMPKRDEVDPRSGDTAGIPYLLDTNHAASEVVVIDGQTYARGVMSHAPAWRAPDHKRLALGKTWHLVVKNTVPIGA